MNHLLKLCIVVFCALGNLVESEKVKIRKNVIANAWQSSAYDNNCFINTVENFGQWNYFYTKWSPDSYGYQWLLLKLVTKIRLLSVTVHGSLEVPEGAHNIEILHGDKLPDGINTNANCSSTISHTLNGFIVCGKTIADYSSLMYEVKCNNLPRVQYTQYIMLRRFAQTDKHMYFEDLHIDQVPKMIFQECSNHGGKFTCNQAGLQSLVPGTGTKRTVKVCVPCNNITNQSSCALVLPSAIMKYSYIQETHRHTKLNTRLFLNANNSFCLLMMDLKLGIEKHGWHFQCNITLASGERFNDIETIGFIMTPKKVELNASITEVNGQKFLVHGRDAIFYFSTDFAFPKPVHKCRLIDASMNSQTDIQGQLLTPKHCQNETHTNGFYIKVTSIFSIYVNSSIENKQILCRYELQGDKSDTTKVAPIPAIFYPCKTKFSISPPISWKDGSTQSFTVDSSANNQLLTSHTCFLETAQRNASLVKISSTNRSSTFSVNVTKLWGRKASVLCLVNQSGIFQTWTRQQLPSVLYQAKDIKIKLHTVDMRNNTETHFTVEFSDAGNPSADFRCSINGKNLPAPVRPTSSSSTVLHWSFKPLSSDNKQIISCQIDQVLDRHLVFSQTVNSTKLNVKYKARSSWTARNQLQSRSVMEGQPLTFEVTSVGGNPKPSHQCWFNRSLLPIYATVSVKKETQLISRFSFNSTRNMNGDSVICMVTQKDQSDMNETFSQNFAVFYKAKSLRIVDLLSVVYEGTTVAFSVWSENGNPNVTHSCGVKNGRIYINSSASTQEGQQTAMFYVPDKRDTTVQCYAVQYDVKSQIVFNQTIFHDISVLYASNNSMIISPQHPVMEGSTVNVTLVSSYGRHAVTSFKCYIGDTELTLLNTTRTLDATYAIYSLNTTRAHNQLSLKGKFKQDNQLISWHNTSLTVYFHPIIDLSALSFNGSHIVGSISVSEANPSLASVNCLVLMPNSKVLMSQTWNLPNLTNSIELQLNSTPVAYGYRVLVNIICQAFQSKISLAILQVRTINFGTVSGYEYSRFFLTAVGISAGSLAVAVAATAALLVLICQRMGCGSSRGSSINGERLKNAKSLAAKQHKSLNIKLDISDHYIC